MRKIMLKIGVGCILSAVTLGALAVFIHQAEVGDRIGGMILLLASVGCLTTSWILLTDKSRGA